MLMLTHLKILGDSFVLSYLLCVAHLLWMDVFNVLICLETQSVLPILTQCLC